MTTTGTQCPSSSSQQMHRTQSLVWHSQMRCTCCCSCHCQPVSTASGVAAASCLELLLFLGDSRHGHCDMQAQLNGKATHMCSCSSKGSSGLLVLWHAGLEGWLSPAKGKLLVITKQSVNWEDKQVADLSGIIRHLVVGKTVCHVRCHMRNWMPTGLALPSSWCFARKRLLRLGLTLLSLALPI